MPAYINGQSVSVPSVIVTTNDQALVSGAATPTLGLLLIGPANDGQPNTPLTFTNSTAAEAALNSGDLVQAIANAFQPSGSRPAVNTLTVLQVNPLTTASSAVSATAGGPSFSLTTTHYGNPANTAQWMLSAGTNLGYKFSQRMNALMPGNVAYSTVTQDNIGINGLNLYYSGSGTSPTVTTTDSAITVSATTSDTGGTVSLTSSTSLSQAAAAISALAGWNASVAASNPNQIAAAFFDNVTSIAVSTSSTSPTVLTANVYALAQYFAQQAIYFTGTRPANATALVTSTSWTTASGATSTTAANSDWQNAYTTAQSIPGIGIVTPISPSQSIWDMNDAHCHYMQSLGVGRHGYVADALGAAMASETADAALINSNRTSIVWPGVKGTDINGNPTTFAGYLSSAPMLASMRAASPMTQALTGATLLTTGLEQAVDPATAGVANDGGVIALYTDLLSGAVKVSWDRTTWLQSNLPDKVENTVGIEADLLSQDLNQALQPFISVVASPGVVGAAAGTIYERLMYWYGQGSVVVEPQPTDVSLTAANGVISGTAKVALGEPTNYVALSLQLRAGVFSAAG